MPAPRTYAEWMPLLDRFKAGDNECVAEMQQGSIEWTNVVAERWTRHVVDALDERLSALSNELQAELDRSRHHLPIGNAMLVARHKLEKLRTFASVPAIPDEVRSHLQAQIDGWAKQTQDSLERHASRARHDQGQLLKTMREHQLTARPAATPDRQPDPPQMLPRSPRGRRILL